VISPHGTVYNNFTLHIYFLSEVNGFVVVVDDEDDVIIAILNCDLGG
jgi:hypothetical protein